MLVLQFISPLDASPLVCTEAGSTSRRDRPGGFLAAGRGFRHCRVGPPGGPGASLNSASCEEVSVCIDEVLDGQVAARVVFQL